MLEKTIEIVILRKDSTSVEKILNDGGFDIYIRTFAGEKCCFEVDVTNKPLQGIYYLGLMIGIKLTEKEI